jgi:hypothetical protein
MEQGSFWGVLLKKRTTWISVQGVQFLGSLGIRSKIGAEQVRKCSWNSEQAGAIGWLPEGYYEQETRNL